MSHQSYQIVPHRPPRQKHESKRPLQSKSQFYTDDPSDSISLDEENRLTRQFINETKAELPLAHDILAATDWNIEKAVEAFRRLRSTGSPSHTNGSQGSDKGYKPRDSDSKLQRPHRMMRGLSKVYDYDEIDSMRRKADIKCAMGSMPEDSTGAQRNTNISLNNTYVIPDISGLPSDLRDYIEQELIDFVTMNILEKTGHINWWAGRSLSRRLWPLHTTGDGNCLLHAASLAMWGIQDKFLHLRVELDDRLKSENKSGALYRRWRWQQTQSNMEMSLVFSEEEWQVEWDNLLRLSAVSKKYVDVEDDDHQQSVEYYYEFLEEFHVYVLAQILKRPIIVFADAVLRDVDGYPLSPIPFGGIYLPLECKPSECDKSPLLLSYDRSHFTAVVTMASNKSKSEDNPMRDLIPLTGPQADLLPLHFFVDPGRSVDWNNLPEDKCTMMDVIHKVEEYLEVRNIPMDQVQDSGGSDSSDSGSSTSLNSKDTKAKKRSNMTKIKETIKFKNKDKSKKTLPPTQSDPELEPGKELIMCAKLNIKAPRSYQKDIDRYITITRAEFEDKKAKNQLVDPRSLPPIATKDYAKNLSVNTQSFSGATSPAAISPVGGQTMCRECQQYLGTKDQDGLCSICYRRSEGSQQHSKPCRKCKEFQGTEAHHFYCSKCYNELIAGEETPNKSDSSRGTPRAFDEYRVAMSNSPDDIAERHTIRSTIDEDQDRRRASSRHDSQPARFPTSTSYSDGYGNPSLVAAYDRNPQGYLARDSREYTTPPTKPKEQYTTTITLGMDPVTSHHRQSQDRQGLHMSSQSRPLVTQSYNKSRYEDSRDIPITHHSYHGGAMTRRYSGVGSGGMQKCTYCDRFTTNPQRICTDCRSRMSHPRTQYANMYAAQLVKCKRVGCPNPASSNVGLCRDCEYVERQLKASRNTSTNSKYGSMW